MRLMEGTAPAAVLGSVALAATGCPGLEPLLTATKRAVFLSSMAKGGAT
jgi:hypothetical protein